MKNTILLVVVLCFLFSCGKKEKPFKVKEYKTVDIEILLQDSLLNVRALEVYENNLAYFATSSGKIGVITENEEGLVDVLDYKYLTQLQQDTIIPNFRSLAGTKDNGFALSIGSPALLFKMGGEEDEVVYQENHEKAFYDAMDFWNDREGIAIGDPTDDCMSIIITRDGGDTWNKLSCDILPKAKEGEAAFAASDTNIAIVGDKTWIATGGKASRILFSPDKGKTWEVFETPIVQGLETTGMYSVAFYDALNGFAIGGDYTKAADSSANKIRTQDGGESWQLVAQNQSPGYRSCVQYVPNSNAKGLVAIGFKGIDYSSDSGNTWKHLSDAGYYTLRFLNDSTAYAAGAGKISKLTFK